MNEIFAHYIGKTMKAYIDDMLVKSMKVEQHPNYLRQAFDMLEKFNMKLHPSKCAFGVAADNFLGYLVTKIR